jgi:L-fuculose-phosphate aldolase
MPRSQDLTHPRDALVRTMERIYRYRMTTTSGGNLSVRDDDGMIWITPARVDKGRLRREDIVEVAPDGHAEGVHPPSSESPFHRAIYQARPDLRAIVHAHPVALVAFSMVRRVPDTRLLPQTRRVCGAVGFAPYALPGSEALGRNIAATFAAGHDCVVLENHGVVTAGATLHEAFERFEALEFCAKTIVKASLVGGVKYLDDEAIDRARGPRTLGDYEPATPLTSREKELRHQVAEFVRRAYQQRLMISTQGAFSARLDADSFLITCHRRDRQTLGVDDIVLVHQGRPEAGQVPSSSWANHRAIYEAHPGIEAIVNAYPVNATAFSVTGTPLDARTIPESYLFLREVRQAAFGARTGDGAEPARLVSPRDPVLILQNDGAQVCGTSVLDAFDRLEVLESTAEAMINGRALGPMVPMSDEAIAELDRAFGLA